MRWVFELYQTNPTAQAIASLSLVCVLGMLLGSVQVRGVRGISFPVRTFDGNAVAALAVPYLEQLDDPNRKSLDQAREALREAAGRLSLAIGGGDAGT